MAQCTEAYAQQLSEVALETKAKDVLLSAKERESCRSALGGLSWLAKQSRPDLSFEVSRLLSELAGGDRSVGKDINKLVLPG